MDDQSDPADEAQDETGEPAEDPGPPPEDPAPPPEVSSSSRWPLLAALVAVLVAVGLGVLYLQASGDRDDAEAALDTAQQDVQRLTTDLATQSEQLTGEIAEAQTALTDTQGDLAESEDRGDRLEADLEAANASLSEANQQLDEANLELEEASAIRQGVTDFVSAAMEAGAGMQPADAECVTGELVESMGVTDLLVGFIGAAEATSDTDILFSSLGVEMINAMVECDVDINSMAGASAYGDDPTLDTLYDGCAAGSGSDCDQLYDTSPFGSEYERFGATCGDRFTLAEAPFRCEGTI